MDGVGWGGDLGDIHTCIYSAGVRVRMDRLEV